MAELWRLDREDEDLAVLNLDIGWRPLRRVGSAPEVGRQPILDSRRVMDRGAGDGAGADPYHGVGAAAERLAGRVRIAVGEAEHLTQELGCPSLLADVRFALPLDRSPERPI